MDSTRGNHNNGKNNVVGSHAAKATALRLRSNGDSRQAHSVLTKTNFLIQTAEVRAEPITSLRELEQCAASMFVAIFESMFRVRLRGIVREPERLQDYAQNAQLVIDAISSAFHVDIRHINGNLICAGHRASISTLVDVFIEILTEKVSSRRGRSRSRSEERQQFREGHSPASGGTEGLLDVSGARRRRPTSAPPPTERNTGRRTTSGDGDGDGNGGNGGNGGSPTTQGGSAGSTRTGQSSHENSTEENARQARAAPVKKRSAVGARRTRKKKNRSTKSQGVVNVRRLFFCLFVCLFVVASVFIVHVILTFDFHNCVRVSCVSHVCLVCVILAEEKIAPSCCKMGLQFVIFFPFSFFRVCFSRLFA